MLRHLSIRDFVIVAALDLEFDSGFSVFPVKPAPENRS